MKCWETIKPVTRQPGCQAELSEIKEKLWALPEDMRSRKSVQSHGKSTDIDAQPWEIYGILDNLCKSLKIIQNY